MQTANRKCAKLALKSMPCLERGERPSFQSSLSQPAARTLRPPGFTASAYTGQGKDIKPGCLLGRDSMVMLSPGRAAFLGPLHMVSQDPNCQGNLLGS